MKLKVLLLFIKEELRCGVVKCYHEHHLKKKMHIYHIMSDDDGTLIFVSMFVAGVQLFLKSCHVYRDIVSSLAPEI